MKKQQLSNQQGGHDPLVPPPPLLAMPGFARELNLTRKVCLYICLIVLLLLFDCE